ncbi:hypothetical protein C8R45DRAFT_923618 [Mycena sanguinolenta]|nr:hypothetical protein C8R45DRAFT_923618 [Mycena sanguinolenta]
MHYLRNVRIRFAVNGIWEICLLGGSSLARSFRRTFSHHKESRKRLNTIGHVQSHSPNSAKALQKARDRIPTYGHLASVYFGKIQIDSKHKSLPPDDGENPEGRNGKGEIPPKCEDFASARGSGHLALNAEPEPGVRFKHVPNPEPERRVQVRHVRFRVQKRSNAEPNLLFAQKSP